MPYNLLLISGDAKLTQRLQSALGGEAALMTADPRSDDGQSLAKRFDPHGLIVDAGTHTGTKTVLESIAALHQQFPALPLIVIGDEMSAQLILSSFRAGANDFLDRESSDAELRAAILSRLRDNSAKASRHASATLVDILSPSPSDEDFDFALNAATLIAVGDKERRVLLLDFSLPASPARLALGLELNFAIPAAIRDIARLDRTFLDSALARSVETGLYVLPLADEAATAANLPALRDVLVLLQMLRSLFDVVVIHWGAFSRQAALSGLAGENRHVFLCCNQRFASIRNAKSLLAELEGGNVPHAEPVIVIHQLAPNATPTPDDMVRAIGGSKSLVLRTTSAALIHAQNRGKPLSLAGPSHYADALRGCLAAAGLLAQSANDKSRNLFDWLRKVRS
jgi:pilus assembly protein CpaE